MMNDINYTEIIQKINSELTRLNFGRKNNDNDEINIAQNNIDELSLLLLKDKSKAAEEIKHHYNNITYNINNGTASVTTYLKESIIREILQNIIDCNYNGDICLSINFKDDSNSILFFYNEEGFKISNVISFLSLDHTSKDSNNTGAFGIGAKGAIVSANSMLIKSWYTNESIQFGTLIKIKHIVEFGKKRLFLEKMQFENNLEGRSGSEIELVLEKKLYDDIKVNFQDLTGENVKGKFITPMDLMFASLKKPGKKIYLFMDDEKCQYQIEYVKEKSLVNFKRNEELIVGLKVFESNYSKFSYLVPYNRHSNREMPKFITDHCYNYFSTYELTGALNDPNLPKFYINIPTIDESCEKVEDEKYYITTDRKGIQENKKIEVERLILRDFKSIIDKFKHDLILFTDKSYRYILKFLYEFVEYQSKKSVIKDLWENEIKSKFFSEIIIEHKNGQKFKVPDFKLYRHEQQYLSEAVKIKEIPFLFREENYSFRNTKFDAQICFYFVLLGEQLIIYHPANIDDEYMCTYSSYTREQFLNSKHYKQKSDVFCRILYELNYRDGNEILLISAEADTEFTENTLLKLLEALEKDKKIVVIFNSGLKILRVGDKEYKFKDTFKITLKDILYYAYTLKTIIGIEFFEFIRVLYIENLLGKSTSDLSPIERIEKYRKQNFTFEFNHSSHNLIDVFYNLNNQYSYAKIPIEKDINIENIDYEKIVEITGITNYKFLQNKSIEAFTIDQSIVDIYGFDIEKMKEYSSKSVDADRILNKIMFGHTKLKLGEKDLVAFVKGGIFKEIIQLDNVSYDDVTNESDFILIISHKNKDEKHSKIGIAKMSKFLDTLLNAGGKIQQLYKPVRNPIVKMLDQFNCKLKPILRINKEEIEILKSYLSRIEQSDKRFFAKDLNNKLYGYSTNCCLCDYKSNILNAFQLREKIEYIENKTNYRLSLYVCANHYFESESWIISDVKFKSKENKYEISFENWIKNINKNEFISASLLKCEIHIVKKSSYRMFELDNEDEEQSNEMEKYKVMLTPLMAVKWLSENEELFDKKKGNGSGDSN